MSSWRNILLAAALGLVACCAPSTASAGLIASANSTPATPIPLATGQLIVSDDLNGDSGRPATLLAEYDPTYHTLITSADLPSSLGNGLASELLGIPLRPNGSAYFRVTGAPDTLFIGDQTQSGRYSYQFNVYDAHHNLIQTIGPTFENVAPGMIDNIWLNPSSDPRRVGGTVDVILNNVIGPGTGNSIDFFQFTGLAAGQAFTAKFDASAFPGMLGVFNSAFSLIAVSNPNDPAGTLSGHADALGHVIIGVTGAGDTQFTGQHADTGAYTLQVIPSGVTPEPSTAVLAGLGATLAALLWQRRRRAVARTPE
jgi:hypothetical protein